MMTIGLIFFGATGVLTMIAKKKLEWSTKKIMIIRKFHKLLAFLFWGFSLVVITTGISFFVWQNTEMPENNSFLVLLNIVLMIGITTVCEFWY